ncbi:MAG: hypothetical protein QOD53_1953 [Thermoleophilaceae bacterium]|nr:hypothetical protein [Thermoleophilaceae bacterium]
MRPLFLLSLPRSGSTLVQRVLAAHPEIATVSEPWLLLAPLYATRLEGSRADYSHEMAAGALQDFCAALPGGRDEYRAAVRDFALTLYGGAGGDGATYFLDKTPRYHAIAGELADVFPDARFVFLWRDPLAVLASFLDTFRAGRFEPYNFSFDLFDGVASLTAARSALGSRAHALRYEDLVGGRGDEWRSLFEYLELEFDPGLLTRFADTPLAGRYGDQSRAREISAGSLDSWRSKASSRVSNRWCRHYIRWIGPERMRTMGYDHDAALRTIAAVPAESAGATDALRLACSWAAHRRRARALRLPEGPRAIMRAE